MASAPRMSPATPLDGATPAACGSPPDADNPNTATYDNLTFPTHLSDEALQARLLDELCFVDAHKARYNIGLFLNDTRWGVLSFDRYLCILGKPGVVRIIGTVRFIQTKNERLNVGIEPLAPVDVASARTIQYGKARPPHPPPKSTLVYASKFLNGDMFTEACDATDVLLPWPDMQDYKIPFRRIRATGSVLLECLLRRYLPANAPYGSGWDKFSIAFELTRVTRLAVGPGIPDYLPD